MGGKDNCGLGRRQAMTFVIEVVLGFDTKCDELTNGITEVRVNLLTATNSKLQVIFSCNS